MKVHQTNWEEETKENPEKNKHARLFCRDPCVIDFCPPQDNIHENCETSNINSSLSFPFHLHLADKKCVRRIWRIIDRHFVQKKMACHFPENMILDCETWLQEGRVLAVSAIFLRSFLFTKCNHFQCHYWMKNRTLSMPKIQQVDLLDCG